MNYEKEKMSKFVSGDRVRVIKDVLAEDDGVFYDAIIIGDVGTVVWVEDWWNEPETYPYGVLIDGAETVYPFAIDSIEYE